MMKAWSDGGFWSSHTFRHDWRGLVVSPVWNRHSNDVLDSLGSRQVTWQSQTRKWEVAIKTMYIPWGSLALPKPQALLGTKFTASSCQGGRLALYPARVMNSWSSASGLRIPSTLWPLDWSHGAGCVNPCLTAFTRQTYRQVRLFRLSTPVSRHFRDFAQHFPTFFTSCDFKEKNRISGLFANLSL